MRANKNEESARSTCQRLESRRNDWARRASVASAIGIAAGLLSLWYITTKPGPYIVAFDFTWGWRSAVALLRGQNPYELIRPVGEYPFDAGYKYPLTYALLSLPFARMSPAVAMAAFSGTGMTLFAFGLFQNGYHRWPLLVSWPVIANLILGQSSLWSVTAALIPALAWVGFWIKPQVALIGLAYRPRWWVAAGIGTLVGFGVCFVLEPRWLVDWLRVMFHDTATHYYVPALFVLPMGPFLLLAAMRWRTAEGRMLLVSAVVPQNQSFYSGVYAMLVAQTYRESLILAVVSNLGAVGWTLFDPRTSRQFDPIHQAPWLIAFVYFPAILMELRRPRIQSQDSRA